MASSLVPEGAALCMLLAHLLRKVYPKPKTFAAHLSDMLCKLSCQFQTRRLGCRGHTGGRGGLNARCKRTGDGNIMLRLMMVRPNPWLRTTS